MRRAVGARTQPELAPEGAGEVLSRREAALHRDPLDVTRAAAGAEDLGGPLESTATDARGRALGAVEGAVELAQRDVQLRGDGGRGQLRVSGLLVDDRVGA